MAVSSKFENVSLEGGARATQLVRRYGNLYSEARLDALDALDSLDEVSQFDDLKVKILYSVLVVRFTTEMLNKMVCNNYDVIAVIWLIFSCLFARWRHH